MKIYNYNPETGEFIGESLADPDPLDAGNWLVPANAVTVQPPSAPNKAAVYLTGEWTLVPDHRGETWYMGHGLPVEITTLEVPEGVTPTEPPAPPVQAPNLSPRQLRLALLETGTTEQDVDAMISTDPDPASRNFAQIEWKYATEFERDHPLILQIGPALGYTPEQIDTLWLWAADL